MSLARPSREFPVSRQKFPVFLRNREFRFTSGGGAGMDLERIADGADRFAAYIEELTGVIGHADRAAPLRDYCTGLLAAEGRRSVEPMAAVTAPGRVSVQHQKLLHFVGEGKWSDQRVLAKVREMVVPAIERHGPIKAWIV